MIKVVPYSIYGCRAEWHKDKDEVTKAIEMLDKALSMENNKFE